MCGFVGVAGENFLVDNEIVKKSTNLLFRRGPDSEGFLFNDFCKVGFRRLSIIDLSNVGNQPFFSHDKRFAVIFNGEIYNYLELYNDLKDKFKWKSKTDTEVLLNSFIYWGKEFLNKIDGMFSFVIFDLIEKKLFAARDRFGEKPFFYLLKNKNFYFSSSISSLNSISSNKTLFDSKSVNDYLNFGHCNNKNTLFENIFKIQPGHFLEFSKGNLYVKQYFNLLKNNYSKNLKLNNSLETFDQIFNNEIEKKLNSDRPVGIFLSSGIDSSLVAKIASNKNKDLKTFSIGFSEQMYDESNLSKKFSKSIGLDHYEKIVSSKDLIELIPKIYDIYDEPVTDQSLLPTFILCKFAKESGVDVCLSGDGGDELFGGYNYYTLMKTKYFYEKFPNFLKFFILYLLKISKKHKIILLKEFLNIKNAHESFLFLKKIYKDLDHVQFGYLSSDEIKNDYDFKNLRDCMNFDFANNLAENYLVKLDRSSMYHSLECRLPFLSKNMYNFSSNININHKINFFNKKFLLKKYAKKHLPNYILGKKKRGFETPIKEWLKRDLYEWARDLVSDDQNYKSLYLNKNKINTLLRLHKEGKRDTHAYLWPILMLLSYNKKRII
jgi:asparagine synthase (glutamine-hydrolysing)